MILATIKHRRVEWTGYTACRSWNHLRFGENAPLKGEANTARGTAVSGELKIPNR